MLDADVCKGKSRPHAYKSGQRVGNRYFLRMSFMNDPFTLNSATARTLVASVPGMAILEERATLIIFVLTHYR